jgi:hypothetical protein
MSAFDVLTAPGLVASSDAETRFEPRTDDGPSSALPSRQPRRSWEEVQSKAVVESPADTLFGDEKRPPRTPFKSSLGAAFESFGLPENEPTGENESRPAAQQTYDAPLGPQPRPAGEPVSRRDRSDSTTIAGLLAEALAAYQSSTEDEPPRSPEPEPLDGFDTLMDGERQSGVTGRHRSPE